MAKRFVVIKVGWVTCERYKVTNYKYIMSMQME